MEFKVIGMTDERIRALERSVANAPGDSGARLALARELARIARRDEARAHVAQVLRAEPVSVEAVRTLDDLGFDPLAHDAPWPTAEGQNDRARRSAHPGARRGQLVKRMRIGREGETASSLSASATTIYVATSGRRLVALDASSGAARWVRDFQTVLDAPVIGEGERLLVVADGSLQLLDGAKGGETLWSVRTPDERPAFTLAPRGLALVTCGELLDAFDVATGEPRWSFKAHGLIDACPVVDSSAIFLAGAQGAIHALDFEGLEVSRLRIPQGRVTRIALLESALFMQCRLAASMVSVRSVVTRTREKLERKTPLEGSLLTGFGCSVNRDRFLVLGGVMCAIYDTAGHAQPYERSFGAAVADAGSCVFADDGRGVHWFDGTLTRVMTVLPGANNPGPMAIGPDSTLLVASPRGILHVIA